MNAAPARRWTSLIPAGYSLALALLVLGPLLAPGYLLLRDAVSTPRSYLTDSALGLGDAAPRAVPQDALIATLSTVIDGGLLVKAILLTALWMSGWGAARLSRELLGVSPAPQLVAATLALWNPYVAERLLQGHWSLLTGYAALPWIALLANRLRSPRPRSASAPAAGGPAAVEVVAAGVASTEPAPTAEGAPATSGPAAPISAAGTAGPAAPATATAPSETGSAAAPGSGTVHIESTSGRGDTAAVDRPGTGRAGAAHPPAWRDWWMWAALGGLLAAAGLTPTGSLLAGCVALLLVGRRNLVPALGLWVLASAPWLVATALAGGGAATSDPAGVAAFAARAEPWLGTLGSLAGLGGIWNSTAVPGSRTTFFAVIGTLLLLTLVATGVRATLGAAVGRVRADAGQSGDRVPEDAGWPDDRVSEDAGHSDDQVPEGLRHSSERVREDVGDSGSSTLPRSEAGSATVSSEVTPGSVGAIAARGGRDSGRYVRRVLVGLAVIAVVWPALGATGWGLAVGEFLVANVPGAGLFRDSQKFAALAMPGYALCAAAGCQVVAEWVSARRGQSARAAAGSDAVVEGRATAGSWTDLHVRTGGVAAVFIVLLLIALPDLAWGVGGKLRPVHYPAGWARVAEMVDAPGDVAVLPGGMFRKFRYSGPAPVLDPAPRMVRRDVLQTGELPVAGGSVAGEGVRARAAEQVLLRGGSAARLGELGVGWVLVEGGTPGPVGESKTTLDQLISVYADRDLRLYKVPGVIADHDASAADRRISGAAHVLWAVLLFGGIIAAAWHSMSARVNRAGTPRRIRSR
ncbi:hypothetical protein LTV02_32770 [Nocardia yamanashiensis]|uniref:hypothetical protein n=1 Tax=Nocardia yamanashiensis TaxID=209247 RepID=UPI001E5CCE3C|nr:hypothetical protein [Nocardia yamanashiensis]UGT40719.1 hypothetical protein LTV02_32770 [Nocardia yamanashiensis]